MVHPLDDLSADWAASSEKWTRYPGKIGAFVAEMDFGTAPPVTAALLRAVERGELGYVSRGVAEEMARATAGWMLEEYGWAVEPDRVRPVGDVLAGLQATVEHFTSPGSPVIVPTPAYMPFLTLPPVLGREVLEVPLRVVDGRYVHDLQALDAAFSAGGELLVLCNPHNPTGRVFDRDELLAVAELVARHGGRVFADEIHAPLVGPGRRHLPYADVSPVAAGHTITATSASKAWNMPGLKCGQLVLTADADLERWDAVGGRTQNLTGTLGAIAATVAYDQGREWLAEVKEYLRGNETLLRRLLAERLPEVGYIPPEGTYLAWLDCRTLGLTSPQEFFLHEADVALTDGAACGRAGRGFVRLNFALPRPLLEQAVERMAGALARR
ncbi:aminotransferase class I/II-fold pyridoxal phosphate-dependent enzyme [Georgenia sp. M64]|uniref:MalY/PatB family protein n=1 Tax=Georgenia sp. M64 TaxID=3120520 RepID=UPI0030E47E76